MPVFKYEALDTQGVGIKDEIEALSQKEAISKIRNMGYFPTKVLVKGAAKKTVAKAAARLLSLSRGGSWQVAVLSLRHTWTPPSGCLSLPARS